MLPSWNFVEEKPFIRKDHSYIQIQRVHISFKLSVINFNEKFASRNQNFGLLLIVVWQVKVLHLGTYDQYNIKVNIFPCKKKSSVSFYLLILFYMQHEALGLNDMSEIWKK